MFALAQRLSVMAKGGFYAVAVGRAPGVYNDWAACNQQVRKISGAIFKKFATYALAADFVAAHGAQPTYGAPPAQEYHSSSSAAAPAPQYDAGGGGAYIWLAGTRKRPPPPALDCFLLRFDGGSRGNPGVTGCGAVIWGPVPLDGGDRVRVWERGSYLGPHHTNNEGEWTALVDGLRAATRLGVLNLVVEGDSELVVKQLTGSYECRAPNLVGFLSEARRLVTGHGWRYLGIMHIMRAGNAAADALANRAMDTGASSEWYAPSDELASLGLNPVHQSAAHGGGGGGGGPAVGQKRGRDGDYDAGPQHQHPRYDGDY
jgi:ribonuclease HI